MRRSPRPEISPPTGGPEAGTFLSQLQLLVNSLLQPWNRMPEKETRKGPGMRIFCPRLVKAVPLFLCLFGPEADKEKSSSFISEMKKRPPARSYSTLFPRASGQTKEEKL